MDKIEKLEKEMETHYFECQCYSVEHTLRFIYDPMYNEICTEVFLGQHRNIFKRIWIAIKYVFGYKCRYGHFDNFMMKSEDCQKLIGLLERVKDTTEA